MAEEPDKGRSWLVAIAALIINFVMAGIYRAQGLLFVEFIEFYDVDRKGASIPFSIRFSVRNLLAPVVGILGQKYGARNIILIGGVVGVGSSLFTSFAPDMMWITITWGFLSGSSSALITVLPQVVISQYFIKHRATAIGISYSGAGIGSLVFPVLLEFIINSYGLHGTFIILAGIIMHTIPAALILKTPPWLKGNQCKNYSTSNVQECKKENGEILPETKTYDKPSSVRFIDCGIQVDDDKNSDIYKEKKVTRDIECKHSTMPRTRSYSYNGLTHQMYLYQLKRTTLFPTSSAIGDYKTISSNPDNVFDVNIEYLKRNSNLLFHMLSMDIPNVEISYRAILLEVEQDDLWHPDENEVMQEIENMYFHIEKSIEIDQISSKSSKPSGLYLKRTLQSGTLTISKKSENITAVKRYLKTYKERGLQQLGKIRSAPNMSNMYNEIARKEYVLLKLRQLCTSNEIRVISHLSQHNPKDVLKVLFQLRNLYKMYNDLETCDLCDSNNELESVETGAIWMHRRVSSIKDDVFKESDKHTNSLVTHIKAALKLHTNPIFLLICFTRAAFYLSFSPVITTFVDFAMDRGLLEADGKFLLAALSFGDLFGRMGLGWITDRGYITLPRYMLIFITLQSACIISMPMMYSKWSILVSIAAFGMLGGSLFIRHPVLVAKYLNPNEQSIAIGCMEFSAGIISLLMPLYIGYFRDTVGSYNQIYYINGLIVLLSGIGWFFESHIVRTATEQQNSTTKNPSAI